MQSTERYCVAISTDSGPHFRRKYTGPLQEVFWDHTIRQGITGIFDSKLEAESFRNELARVGPLIGHPEYVTAYVYELTLTSLYANI